MSDDAYEFDEGGITPKDALNFVGNLINSAVELKRIGAEYKRIDCDMERYRMMRDIAITAITKKYETLEILINKTFEERRMVIEKQFEIIDKGLEQNDFQLVNSGQQHLTAMLKDNPANIFQLTLQEKHQMLENGLEV